MDGHTGGGDTRRVGQSQIALVGHALDGQDGDFPRSWKAVVLQRALIESLRPTSTEVRIARIHLLAHSSASQPRLFQPVHSQIVSATVLHRLIVQFWILSV